MLAGHDMAVGKVRPAHDHWNFLSGCATLSSDGGFGPVEQTAKDRLGKDVKWAVPMLTVMPSISVLLNCWSNHCRPTTPSRSPC